MAPGLSKIDMMEKLRFHPRFAGHVEAAGKLLIAMQPLDEPHEMARGVNFS